MRGCPINVITSDFFLNGINSLENVGIRSVGKEDEAGNKNIAIISLAINICNYDTLECCHDMDCFD